MGNLCSRLNICKPPPPPPPPQWPPPLPEPQPAPHPPQPPSPPPPPSPHPPALTELFNHVNNVFVDNFIVTMENFLDSLQTKGGEGKSVIDFVKNSGATEGRTNSISRWSSFVEGGAEILALMNKQIQPKGDVASPLCDPRQAVAVLLQNEGIFHSIIGALSVIAYLLDQIGQFSDNQIECIKLLKQMVKFAGHVRALNDDMPEEGKRFSDALLVIFEGTMMCATLLKYKKFFSFLRASVDFTRLSTLRSVINQLYGDLNPTVLEKLYDELPTFHPPLELVYPDYAVGIEKSLNHVRELLDMTTEMESPLAVVIYGYGGMGKTTLAYAVVAALDLKVYNYASVEIYEDCRKNDIMSIQKQILEDAFPQYKISRNLTLRDCEDGRNHLTRAFQCHGNKPVFIFIDNAIRSNDLQELLPGDLRSLPRRSRILITTRNLSSTEMLQNAGLERRQYQMNALPDEQAKEILLKRAGYKVEVNTEEMDIIVQICGGIPLALQIMGARLHRQEYRANKSTLIVEALKQEADIRAENVTARLVDCVFNELDESSQEAFLDICFFFSNWNRRHVEEILGVEEITSLEDVGLVKASSENMIVVHDVIRAVGINKSKPCRIMDLQSFEEALKDEKVKLKGVWLGEDEAEPRYQLEGAILSSMVNSLRVLALGSGVRVSERIQKTSKFPELRFLQISDDAPCLPVDLESLERLAVYHGPICVEGVSIYQLPKKLRALKAVGQPECTDFSTQWWACQSMEIRQNSSLEELDLQELKSLQKLPDRLDHFTALKILLLDGCRFQVVPEKICRLSSLMELKLTSCKKLTELPSWIGDLTSLKHLNLAKCIELKKLPESFGQLKSLKFLDLECCWNLKALPSSFGKLNNLNKLSLQSYALKELPSSFGELSSLTELKCNSILLQELPDSFEQFQLLTILDLSLCTQLRSLPPSIEKLSNLKFLNLLACRMLEELPPKVVELPCLKRLILLKCDSLKKLLPSTYERKGKDLTIILPDHLLDKRQ